MARFSLVLYSRRVPAIFIVGIFVFTGALLAAIDLGKDNSIFLYRGTHEIAEWNAYKIEELGKININVNDPYKKKKLAWTGIELRKLEQALDIPESYDLLQVVTDEYYTYYIPAEFYRKGDVYLATRFNGKFFNSEKPNWPKIDKKHNSGAFAIVFDKDLKGAERGQADVDYRAVQVRELHWWNADFFWRGLGLKGADKKKKGHPERTIRYICMRCHMIKNKGGMRATDFAQPPVTKYLDQKTFLNFVTNPKFRDKNSGMFLPRKISRKEALDIYRYLKKKYGQ